MRLVVAFLVSSCVAWSGPAECFESFFKDCIATTSPALCKTCVQTAPVSTACTQNLDEVLVAFCADAPFPDTATTCALEILKDCASSLASSTECRTCVTKNVIDLKKHNCTITDIASADAVCQAI
jgi:hypothetical protein